MYEVSRTYAFLTKAVLFILQERKYNKITSVKNIFGLSSHGRKHVDFGLESCLHLVRRYFFSKCWYPPTILRSVTNQKTAITRVLSIQGVTSGEPVSWLTKQYKQHCFTCVIIILIEERPSLSDSRH
jgi:hypothetical protein